jgi:sodium-dependent phosphate transporter
VGRVSTSTIAGGIADPAAFQYEPEIYAYGMMIVLWVSFAWQTLSSYYGYNTSSTHTISKQSLVSCLLWLAIFF